MLFLAGVDRNIVVLGVLSHDHALVDQSLRTDEEQSSLLGLVKTITRRFTVVRGDERTGKLHGNLSAIGRIAVKKRIDDALAVGRGKKFGTITEQAARGDHVFDARAAADRVHGKQVALSLAELFHNRADVLHRDVERDVLHRLALFAVDLFVKHAGVRAGKLKALSAHGFKQDREVHFTSARHTELVGRVAVRNAKRNVF